MIDLDLYNSRREATLLTAGSVTNNYRAALVLAQVNSREQKDLTAVVGAAVVDERPSEARAADASVSPIPRWRYGGRVEKTVRKELLGFHRAVIATESYADVDSSGKHILHSSVAAEDFWCGLPRTLVTAGVRIGRRAGINFALPNAGVTHDVTNESRSRVFGHIGLYLDREGRKTQAAIVGVENEVASDVALRLSLTTSWRAPGSGTRASVCAQAPECEHPIPL